MTAPDGLQYEIGHDLIEATMSGGRNVKSFPATGPTNTTKPPKQCKPRPRAILH